jgi:hypothetical protein
MSNRFHSKYHRHNHHSTSVSDVRYPDASHDPIASHLSPFLGDFVMIGTLSARAEPEFSSAKSNIAGTFESNELALLATSNGGLAIRSDGDVLINGSLSAYGMNIMGQTIVTGLSGNYLILNVNNGSYAIPVYNVEDIGVTI